METPPIFQEAPRCDVCNCSFNTFRRRHHCRSCGKTLCHDHSSNQMALPQFGIYTNVRVCNECFNNSSRSIKNGSPNSSAQSSAVTDRFSKLSVGDDAVIDTHAPLNEPVIECKCGMPLCICEAPIPDPLPRQTSTTSISQPIPKPKKAEAIPKKQPSSSSKPNSFFNLGQENNSSSNNGSDNYNVSGEGLREAIKSSDVNAVKKLLSEGVDANYCDKQGSTLLHLAALFNQTDIAIILMDHGADANCKNAQGETPIDCAPVMLQNKLRNKMEEGRTSAQL